MSLGLDPSGLADPESISKAVEVFTPCAFWGRILAGCTLLLGEDAGWFITVASIGTLEPRFPNRMYK